MAGAMLSIRKIFHPLFILTSLSPVLIAGALGSETAKDGGRPDPLVIQSGAKIQEKPLDNRKEWYKRGVWPLVGEAMVVAVPNCITIAVVFLQSSRSFRTLARQRRLDLIMVSLNEFYDPLLTLLEINGAIFSQTGPRTFPDDPVRREAAAQIWTQMREKILDNNNEIELILKTKSHLIYKTDSLNSYKDLLLHVAMYKIFQTIPTERYDTFQFPQDITRHVASQRTTVISELNALTGVRS